jgi:hypothetical protein
VPVQVYSNFKSNTSILFKFSPSYLQHSNEYTILYSTLTEGKNPYLLELKTSLFLCSASVPKFIDPVFAKTSPNRSFSVRFRENWVYKFGHCRRGMQPGRAAFRCGISYSGREWQHLRCAQHLVLDLWFFYFAEFCKLI